MTARTASGDVRVLVPGSPGVASLLDLRSGSGRILGDVGTDPDSPRTITAAATSGNVEVAYGG